MSTILSIKHASTVALYAKKKKKIQNKETCMIST